jgi:hypothetical protein
MGNMRALRSLKHLRADQWDILGATSSQVEFESILGPALETFHISGCDDSIVSRLQYLVLRRASYFPNLKDVAVEMENSGWSSLSDIQAS